MAEANTADNRAVGVILAGGQSRRMGGGDKALALLAGRPLLAYVVDRLRPQVGRLVLNANGDPGRFRAFRVPVTADATAEFAGPLGGILAGMTWAAAHVPTARWIVTVPGDTPLIPGDLVARLLAEVPEGGIAVARSRGETHPVAAAFSVALRDDLAAWLQTSPDRSVRRWAARHSPAVVDFPDGVGGVDPFFNVNTPEDLAWAEELAPPLPQGE